MHRVPIKDLNQYYNQTLTIQGFVDSIRDLQYVQFLVLKDETGKVQVTIEKQEQNQSLVELVSNLTLESTIKVTGMIVENAKVKMGGKEIIPTQIEITSHSLRELPIDFKNKENALRETRLDYRFLDLRREDNHLFFQCETLLEHAFREYFMNHDFIEIHTPKISAKAAESGAELFHLDYFGNEACLSQSPQLYKQMAMAAAFGKVFEIGPAFRAENSHTSYHATEINMLDMEMSFIESMEEVMDVEEAFLKYAFNRVQEVYGAQIEKQFGITLSDTSITFPRITFTEAKRILKEKYQYVGESDFDFERKEENLLGQYAKETYHSDFIFITHYPLQARPFYTMKGKDGFSESFDLIYKGIEVTSGAQREHRYEILRQQIEEKGLNCNDFQFYLEFFQYGCPPHGGLGFGIARLLMQMFEIDNIREATFIYRGPTRLKP